MRIGLFTDSYHPSANGVVYVVDIMRRGFEAAGHEVFVFAPAPYLTYKETDPHVISLPAIRGVSYKEEMTSVYFKPWELKRVADLKLDIIHFFTPNQVGLLGVAAALKQDIPLVGQYSTDIVSYVAHYPFALKVLLGAPYAAPIVLSGRAKQWTKAFLSWKTNDSRDKWARQLSIEYMTSIHNRCDAVIALSRRMLRQLQSHHTTAPLHLIPTGVDALPSGNRKDLANLRSELGLTAKAKVVLYVGRLAAEKNLDLLVDAFEQVAGTVPHSYLLFVGDFDYRAELEKRAARSGQGDRILFLGHIPHAELGPIYGLADVFAFPSLTDTQGLVLHEAAHAGLPFVMIDSDTSEVVIKGRNGLFAKNNAGDFAAKLIQLLTDRELATKMGAASRVLAAKFSEARQNGQVLELYTKLIKTHRSDHPQADHKPKPAARALSSARSNWSIKSKGKAT